MPRTRSWTTAGANAGRARPDRRRDGLAAFAGERGRVFLARALLQNAEVVMLDESLGALDPQNFRQCLDCVTRRAKTLLVVAHP